MGALTSRALKTFSIAEKSRKPPFDPSKNQDGQECSRMTSCGGEPRQLQGKLYPLNTFLTSVSTLEALLGRYGHFFCEDFSQKWLKICIFSHIQLNMPLIQQNEALLSNFRGKFTRKKCPQRPTSTSRVLTDVGNVFRGHNLPYNERGSPPQLVILEHSCPS